MRKTISSTAHRRRRAGGGAAQASAQNWTQLGGSAEHSRHNANETAIGTATSPRSRSTGPRASAALPPRRSTWGGIVYVSGSRGGLFAIDARTGTPAPGGCSTNQAVLGSPAVANGIVHVASSARHGVRVRRQNGSAALEHQGGRRHLVVARGCGRRRLHDLARRNACTRSTPPPARRSGAPPHRRAWRPRLQSRAASSTSPRRTRSSHAYEAATGRGLWSAVVSATGAPLCLPRRPRRSRTASCTSPTDETTSTSSMPGPAPG